MRPAWTLVALCTPTLAVALGVGWLRAQPWNVPVVPQAETAEQERGERGETEGLQRLPAVEESPTSDQPGLERLPPLDPQPQDPSPGTLIAAPAAGPVPKEVVTRQPPQPVGPDDPASADPLTAMLPPGFVPWWQNATVRPLGTHAEGAPIDVESLIVEALRFSARIQAISDNAVIAETSITRAAAAFDTHAFMESKFVRVSVPTGSTLEAGFNVPRLREGDWFYKTGARKRNTYGGKVELSQQIGLKDSNSQFFYPDNQGNSRLTLSFNQPLLNGAGQAYNTSLVVLAKLDTSVAADRTAAELQDHLLEVIETHWRLYEQRAVLVQRREHLQRAEEIRQRLEQRQGLDTLGSQLARARAAVATRRSGIIRAEGELKNAESRLRALINSPQMLAERTTELVPIQSPLPVELQVDPRAAFLTALENRSEIDAATRELDAARVRLNMAQNELLPVLDLVLESFVSGLQGDNAIGEAWLDQFSRGEPSYTAGLLFEVPLDRRAARSNQQRRLAELRQLSNQFKAAVETLHSEVEIAVRDVDVSYREIQARYVAMVAAQADTDYLQRRWEALPGDDRAASFTLEDLLDAQDRLVLAEAAFVEAQVAHTLSLARLNRATGMLLKHERIQLVRESHPCDTSIRFEKWEGPPPSGR
ncbi:MAG: TolC family protein [Pirellulales bacterium]